MDADPLPPKRKRKRSNSPIRPRVNDFQKNDLELLHSGMLADGTIKCQGRTWKVHRALLSSRLKFFKAAFCGSFAEATSKEIDLPEASPDSVDIAIRYLYREEIDLDALDTPLLCVSSWKLADYIQLDTLKSVAASALNEHLNAMLLLACSDKDLKKIKPVWLAYFLEAFRQVCAHSVLRPLQNEFVAFLWIARFEVLHGEVWETLNDHQDVRDQLHQLLIRHRFSERPLPLLVSYWHDIERAIHTKYDPEWENKERCSYCKKKRPAGWDSDIKVPVPDEPWFYNPLPVYSHAALIGEMKWCKCCADNIIKARSWPWNPREKPKNKIFRPIAWCWTEDDYKSQLSKINVDDALGRDCTS